MSRVRQHRVWLAAALVGFAVTACSRDEVPEAPKPQAQPNPPTQEAPQPAAGMNCDMSQDMSKMTAEEHRQMMERCQKQDTPGATPAPKQ